MIGLGSVLHMLVLGICCLVRLLEVNKLKVVSQGILKLFPPVGASIPERAYRIEVAD